MTQPLIPWDSDKEKHPKLVWQANPDIANVADVAEWEEIVTNFIDNTYNG